MFSVINKRGKEVFTQSLAKFLMLFGLCLLPSISQAELPTFDSRFKASRDLNKIFHRPDIIGASVSAGFITESPGDRAASRYTSKENINHQVRWGAEGKEFTFISPAWAKQYSIIIGVDFLFWDSTLSDPTESIRALKNLVSSAARAGVPLVLGDIPQLQLLFYRQTTRDLLNKQIHSACKVKNGCYVIPLDRLHQQAETEGIVVGGQRYFYRDMTFEGLHLNDFGSEYVARLILRLLKGRS